MKPEPIIVKYSPVDIPVSDLDSTAWHISVPVVVTRYWSGDAAPEGRHFTAFLFWTDSALYVRFIAKRSEPMVVSNEPFLDNKTLGLWDRDVCELFVAPDRSQPNKYFEFEAAPTGEWVDLAINITPNGRETDSEYASGMLAAARIGEAEIFIAMKIGWEAFGKRPEKGDVWLGNLFRCVGADPGRGYLAWRPTMTPEPAFHVPEKFGEFMFSDDQPAISFS